jgi:WD40 repeat protein
MTEARIGHTATLLNDSALTNFGKVLIVGSVDTTAELYNPATGTFTATGSMHHARTSPTATLLSNTGPNAGKVLIVGGNTTSGDLVAELYDPGSGAFTDTGSTTILRAGHTATLLTAGLLAGQVLIAGGSGSASAELYNPATGMFTQTGDMTDALTGHTATALGMQDGAQSGDVLIVGINGSADLYDPGTAAFARIGSLLPSMRPSDKHTANLRNDGTVLVAGGDFPTATYRLVRRWFHFTCLSAGTYPQSTAVAALFAPESDGFTQTASLNTSRDGQTATVLSDGAVLIVGGTQHTVGFSSPFHCATTPPAHSATVLSSAERFK